MHECPYCYDVCYCDLEDHENDPPDDCSHLCDPEDMGEFDDHRRSE